MGSNDMEMRRNVGYMTQAFSLYGELTVRQNLELHAQLYHLPPDKIGGRIKELLQRYDLENVANSGPRACRSASSSGCSSRWRCCTSPPSSSLTSRLRASIPIARDAFWRTLIDLSRDDGVTIFLSTHFMNEAERCDRISLMHAGKVLAVGAPLDLVKERGSDSLEDTFVGYLADAAGIDRTRKIEAPAPATAAEAEASRVRHGGSIWRAYGPMRAARRSNCCATPSGLPLPFLGPIILMLAFGYGISFDIENLQMAAFDQDDTPQSRAAARRLFRLPIFLRAAADRVSAAEADAGCAAATRKSSSKSRAASAAICSTVRGPEVDGTVDGAMTFRGETAQEITSPAWCGKQGDELAAQLRVPGPEYMERRAISRRAFATTRRF